MNNADCGEHCECDQPFERPAYKLPGKAGTVGNTKKTARAVPSMLLSLLIAFFPKCPFCWAAYMSMFGSLGLAQLPYLKWLLPVLMALLAVHLFLLYKKIPQKGYLPFVLSLAGAIIIIGGRTYFPAEKWLLITGMSLVISGSLLNSFSFARLPFASK
jgi:hypothetical protein